MDVKTMDIDTLSWDTRLIGESAIRISTGRGVFTVTERNGELEISVEHKIQVVPVASNVIALNEFISLKGENF